MAKSTKHIVGAGAGKTKKQLWQDKLKTTPKKPIQTSPPMRKASKKKKSHSYVSSYLDLSPNTPGKYGVDY